MDHVKVFSRPCRLFKNINHSVTVNGEYLGVIIELPGLSLYYVYHVFDGARCNDEFTDFRDAVEALKR